MCTMNQALYNLYQRRLITLEQAYAHAGDADELRSIVEGRGIAPGVPAPQGSSPRR
jgi:Tfp pilus assembly ATPase PilU